MTEQEQKEFYYNQKAKYAWQLYNENKPFVKVYSVIEHGSKFVVLKDAKKDAKYKYQLAGGGVEEGESIAEATIREVKEETGLDVTFERELDVLHFYKTWRYEGKAFDVLYEAHVVLSKVDTVKHGGKMGLAGEFDDVKLAEVEKQEMLQNVGEFVRFHAKFD